jgi:hypothetical protein
MIAGPVTTVTAESHVKIRDGTSRGTKTCYTPLILNLG